MTRKMDRRHFLRGLGISLIAAPAVLRVSSLMPVRGIVMPWDYDTAFQIAMRREFIEQFKRNTSYIRQLVVKSESVLKGNQAYFIVASETPYAPRHPAPDGPG